MLCVMFCACGRADAPLIVPALANSAITPATEPPPLTICQPKYDEFGSCVFERCSPRPPTCQLDQDTDCDGFPDTGPGRDNCMNFCNTDQENTDGDYMGDVCDPCPLDGANDLDGDGLCAEVDNCPAHFNQGQENADADAFGDACDQVDDTEAAALALRLDAIEKALLMGEE
jgi:hypothetical protein